MQRCRPGGPRRFGRLGQGAGSDHLLRTVILNLAARYSADAAERFLEIYQAQAGLLVDPRADVAALCSFGPDSPQFLPRQVAARTPVDATGMRRRVEDVLRQALRRL